MPQIYSGMLKSAAENFLVRLLEDPERHTGLEEILDTLVEAAMHVVTDRPWGYSDPSQVVVVSDDTNSEEE